MAEISEEQLTIVENALVAIREGLDPDTTPKDLMQQILDAEQIVSGLLDNTQTAGPAKSSPTDKGGPM